MSAKLNILLATQDHAGQETRALMQCARWASIDVEVHVATDFTELMSVLENKSIDVVLMDKHLPTDSGRKLQGKEAIVEVRHRHDGALPAVFCMFSSNETQNYWGCFSGAEFSVNKERFLEEMETRKSFEEAEKLAAALLLVALRRE